MTSFRTFIALRAFLITVACLCTSSPGSLAFAQSKDSAETSAVSGGDEAADASDEAPAKPPQSDSLCPWGRLGDGHGRFLRCLTDEEARSLAQTPKRSPEATSDAKALRAEESAAANAAGVSATVQTVVFEGEGISTAKPNLSGLAADYQACVANNGGVRRDSGEVRVRFHVDGRGIARESSVSRRRNVSVRAARCVAEAVNRRFIGNTRAKAVGTVVVHFARSGH